MTTTNSTGFGFFGLRVKYVFSSALNTYFLHSLYANQLRLLIYITVQYPNCDK